MNNAAEQCVQEIGTFLANNQLPTHYQVEANVRAQVDQWFQTLPAEATAAADLAHPRGRTELLTRLHFSLQTRQSYNHVRRKFINDGLEQICRRHVAAYRQAAAVPLQRPRTPELQVSGYQRTQTPESPLARLGRPANRSPLSQFRSGSASPDRRRANPIRQPGSPPAVRSYDDLAPPPWWVYQPGHQPGRPRPTPVLQRAQGPGVSQVTYQPVIVRPIPVRPPSVRPPPA